jgi:hypothetical protein
MKIFNKEIQDGLEDQIKANACTIACSVYAGSVTDQELVKILASANPNQQDLFYIEAILASVGWNDNDDVFDAQEIVKAKDTPIDKQFNFMHDEKDIIGHITSSKIIADNKIISDLSTLPSKFDIVVGSVIYKRWEDPKLQDRMNQLIAQIIDNKWFVSMECLFSAFDYALIDPDGGFKTIARNDQTSFLTKHLRAYGGRGVYEGYKVGRLLREFTFSGKGLVDNPANKRSIIFNFSDVSDQETIFQVVANRELSMSFTEEQYRDLEAKLAIAEKAAKDVADKAVAKEVQDYKGQIDQLSKFKSDAEKQIKELSDELSLAKDVSVAKTEAADTLSKKISDLEVTLAAHKADLDKIEQEKVKASRVVLFSTKEIDSAKAINLVEKCANMTQDAFEALVESFPAKSAEMSPEEKKKLEDEKKAKEAKAGLTDEELLNDLEAVEGAALNVSDSDDTKERSAAAAQWFGELFSVKGEK